MTIIYLHGILLFRTLQVPETEKCPQYDEGMYDVGATCICDNSEKSPPTNDFKRSGMIKILKCDSVIVTSLSTIHGATSKLYHIICSSDRRFRSYGLFVKYICITMYRVSFRRVGGHSPLDLRVATSHIHI